MKLFKEYEIKNLKLKNRLVMPPMCMYEVYNGDGIATPFHQGHYLSRAIGQTGLIIVEATGVLPNGRITDHDLGLYDDNQIDALKQMVDGVHHLGSKIAIQLNHAGRKSTTTNLVHYGPTALKYNQNEIDYIEINQEQIDEVIEGFRAAAHRAHLAGFDAIELHGAHGYLIHQFISPLSNHRDDAYGQDRFLFLKQIVEAVKSVWPSDKVFMIRISGTDHHPDGLVVEDWIDFLKDNRQLFDIIHVSSGGVMSVPITLYPGYQLNLAKAIREQTNIPTIGVGLVNQPELIVSSLELGYCDLIAAGRELLRNPNLMVDLAFKYKKEEFIPLPYHRAYK